MVGEAKRSGIPICPSARKHGIADDDIRHAARNVVLVADEDDEVILMMGPDRAGNLIEVGMVDDDQGPRIIHAMRPPRSHRFHIER